MAFLQLRRQRKHTARVLGYEHEKQWDHRYGGESQYQVDPQQHRSDNHEHPEVCNGDRCHGKDEPYLGQVRRCACHQLAGTRHIVKSECETLHMFEEAITQISFGAIRIQESVIAAESNADALQKAGSDEPANDRIQPSHGRPVAPNFVDSCPRQERHGHDHDHPQQRTEDRLGSFSAIAKEGRDKEPHTWSGRR